MGSGTSHSAQFWGFHSSEEGSELESKEELPFLTSGVVLSLPLHIAFAWPRAQATAAGLLSSPDNKKGLGNLPRSQRQSHGLPKQCSTAKLRGRALPLHNSFTPHTS